MGKSFDQAALVSYLQLATMTWSVANRSPNLSPCYWLFPRDSVYSGTPDNVGPVLPGDVMDAHTDGIDAIRLKVVELQAPTPSRCFASAQARGRLAPVQRTCPL